MNRACRDSGSLERLSTDKATMPTDQTAEYE